MKSKLTAFADATLRAPQFITGGGTCVKEPDPCSCPAPSKGNNGIGQEKRGILDGPPPGLVNTGRGDFNDRSGNRHGVEV